MVKDFPEQLADIADKTRLLMIRHQAQRTKIEELTEEVANLKAELLARTNENEKLCRELEYLKIASAISPDRKTKEEAYAIISNIVREIDRCVADLKE